MHKTLPPSKAVSRSLHPSFKAPRARPSQLPVAVVASTFFEKPTHVLPTSPCLCTHRTCTRRAPRGHKWDVLPSLHDGASCHGDEEEGVGKVHFFGGFRSRNLECSSVFAVNTCGEWTLRMLIVMDWSPSSSSAERRWEKDGAFPAGGPSPLSQDAATCADAGLPGRSVLQIPCHEKRTSKTTKHQFKRSGES